MPKEVSVITAEPGSSASTLAYRADQREVSCGPSRRAVETMVGPMDRMTSATVVVLREVLAHQRHDRDSLADFDDLDRSARDVDRLPPADVRVKRATEVVLVDLAFVE